MLASIIRYSETLPDEDILIFLNDEEIKELENKSLKGDIFEFRDIRKVYSLEIKLVNEMEVISHNGIGVKTNSNEYLIIVGDKYHYQILKEKGWLGTRPNTYFKIDILSEYVANQNEEFTKWLRYMNSRWKNRDRIIEKIKIEGL
ncbi:MAG: hypothetical protein ABIC91_03430 [Nanoarchaeota archaeon]|nr:hypothetical protein [Nanoarchaeota archaeon]MBU1030023.1 hypothetical protein [Nanoarchaeota archaeon]MBU1849967.1 hypothetical protein [Nanoarchaeota archaeon]